MSSERTQSQHTHVSIIPQIKIFKGYFIFIKITLHLQFLQNIGCSPHLVQYTLELILYPVVWAYLSPRHR